ncbi:MAG: redoxin domain-containing protein [Candidatus Bipolaricaulaceae bacterium]
MGGRVFLLILFLGASVWPSFPQTIFDVARGRWALLFVVIPGCPACEEVLPWFTRAAQAFPEIRFLLVTPAATPELTSLAGDLPVYIDHGGLFGASLGVKRAPTAIFLAAGTPISRLDWPFDEASFEKGLKELLAHPVPDPFALLGLPAPAFSAPNLDGQTVSVAELSKPLLLAFFNPRCPACWEDLPSLAELSKDVFVGLLAFGELTAGERAHLRALCEKASSQKFVVLMATSFEVLEAYQVVRSPTYFLLDGKGVVVWGKEGSKGLVEEVQRELRALKN